MNCKDLSHIIGLTNEELTTAELKLLNEHIKQCEDCKTKREAALQFVNSTDLNLCVEPKFAGRESVIEGIFDSVMQDSNETVVQPFYDSNSGGITRRVFSFRFRAAAAIVLFLLTAAMVYEQTTAALKLRELQKRYSVQRAGMNFGNDVVLKEVNKLYNFFADKNAVLNIPADLLVLKFNALSDIAAISANYNGAARKVKESIAKSFPWVEEINFEDGLSKKELYLLSNHQQDFKKIIEQIRREK